MQRVVIVMPAWNEAKNLQNMIGELVEKQFPKIKAEMHLLVVDNKSKDDTVKIIEEASKKHKNIHIIQQGDKSGLGWAYVRGFQHAVKVLKADAVMEMDADLQHPPRFVPSMVEAYLNGADYVIGSRYIKGGSIPKEWAIHRKAMSFFGNLFARIVLTKFSIHDMTTGFRLTKVDGVLNKIDLENIMELERFAYKIDLLYQSYKNAKNVVEVPLQFEPRIEENSKFNIKELIVSYVTVIKLGIKDKIRFIKFGIVGGTGFLVNFIGLELFKRFGLNTYFATLLATELAIISNFILNNVWTFKDKELTKISDVIPQFLKFNLASMFAVIVQPFVVTGATLLIADTSLVRLGALIFALLVLIIPYNYVVYNMFIWKTWKLPKLFKK